MGGGSLRDKGGANISVTVSPEFLKTNIYLLSSVHNFLVRSPIIKKLFEISHGQFNGFICYTAPWCNASTDMSRFTTGIRSEKCVVRPFLRSEKVIECTYTKII